MQKTLQLIILAALLCMACNSPFTAKPRGYYKIDFPEKKYQVFDQPGFPYSFEYPVYANIERDTSFFGDAPENPWWINIDFPQLGGKIYISYKEVGKYSFDKLLSDAFTMTQKHSIKATSIDDSLLATKNGIHGLFFKVGGDVATANQFFLTDSTRHFLRGALYFNVAPNQDSLKPVNDFLLKDMMHMINTFKWK